MDMEGFAKVLVDPKYGEILGVHIIGPRAADSIAQAVVALEYEVTKRHVQYFICSSDLYRSAKRSLYASIWSASN